MSERDTLHRRMEKVIEQYLKLDAALKNAEGNYFRVCIFGSARIQPNDKIYQTVYDLAHKLALMGVDIVTGGGPGLMEAANHAAQDAHVKNVRSYGLPLNIPGLQEVPNPHLDIKSMHQRFSSRLDEFMRLSDGVIIAPGGIGTLLELFYVWQLLQIGLIDSRPVVLLGRDFWHGLMQWMDECVLDHHLVSPRDLQKVVIVDTPDEAIAVIEPVYKVYKETLEASRKVASQVIQNTASPLRKPRPRKPVRSKLGLMPEANGTNRKRPVSPTATEAVQQIPPPSFPTTEEGNSGDTRK